MAERKLIPATELCVHHKVEISFIHSLREYGLVRIISQEGMDYLEEEELNNLEKIIRLHNELDLNMEGIDVVLHLLEQLKATQEELNTVKNQLKFYS